MREQHAQVVGIADYRKTTTRKKKPKGDGRLFRAGKKSLNG